MIASKGAVRTNPTAAMQTSNERFITVDSF
jgi:hypothetical protein